MDEEFGHFKGQVETEIENIKGWQENRTTELTEIKDCLKNKLTTKLFLTLLLISWATAATIGTLIYHSQETLLMRTIGLERSMAVIETKMTNLERVCNRMDYFIPHDDRPTGG